MPSHYGMPTLLDQLLAGGHAAGLAGPGNAPMATAGFGTATQQALQPTAPTEADLVRFMLSSGQGAPTVREPNIHYEAQGPRMFPQGTTGYKSYPNAPYDVQEPGVEQPHPLLDPVDHLAGLLTPSGLRLMRQMGAAMTEPLPAAALRSGRAGLARNERGNLGPPPVDAQGRPLPQSVVRDAEGKLEKFYHGTAHQYTDFTVKGARGAGGDLYGPGIYMTRDPLAATGYSVPESPLLQHVSGDIANQLAIRRLRDDIQTATSAGKPAKFVQGLQDELERKIALSRADEKKGAWYLQTLAQGEQPNIRPVYADLKRPFDIDAPADKALVEHAVRSGLDDGIPLKANGRIDWDELPTNKDVYQALTAHLRDKGEVNDWLQANGYDGILHMARNFPQRMTHQVAIAFSPDDVYPAPNVETLLKK